MKLSLKDITENRAQWKAAGIALPSYDAAAVAEKTRKEPVWVHFGAGNIFRGYIAGLLDQLHVCQKRIDCLDYFLQNHKEELQ